MNNLMKLKLKIILVFILCLTLTTFSFLQEEEHNLTAQIELEKIKAAIKAAGAQWIPGESWVTRLGPEERLKLLGEKTHERGIITPISPPLLTGYPLDIDWRNKDGYNWITPIKDQGMCGSCVAFGACATLESLVRIELYQPNKKIDLSEMRLFMCYGDNCDDGWWNEEACSSLEDYGTPDENCWPYDDEDEPCSNSCSNWQLRTVKISDSGYIEGIESCKTYVAIAPILAAMDVYDDFYYYESGIYRHVYGGYQSGHAICIIGYETTSIPPYWICKNSWGTDWGENGFFKIAMGECRIETLACFWMSGHILPLPPSDAPSNLDADSTSWYDVILNWLDNSNNESGFEIRRKKAGDASFSYLGEAQDNCQSFHDWWFNGDYTYDYKVRAFNLGGFSPYSNTKSFTITSTPISAPSGLNGYFQYGLGAVHLTWYDCVFR
jgi:hypothetical protein